MRYRFLLLALGVPLAIFAACSTDSGAFGDETSSGSGGQTSSGSGGSSSGLGGSILPQGGFNPGEGGGTTTPGCSDTDPASDYDQDGFTEDQGDCNDCDPNVNPNAIEVATPPDDGQGGGPPVPSDEDCDGEIDEPADECDAGLAVGDGDPLNAARAIELCKMSGDNGASWGVVSAQYVRASGAPTGSSLSNGLLPQFGSAIQPQGGALMLALSSGNARDAADPSACNSQTCTNLGAGTPPAGFPQDVPGCAGGTNINDDVGLELVIEAPSNAKGYSYDFAFMSFEYPEWVCSTFNDQYIALVNPPPPGAINGNISFDSLTNPVSVNIALFDHCDPNGIGSFAANCFSGCPSPPNPYCPMGPGFMNGTGFNSWGDSGSTGWLQTAAPIGPGEQFTIRFAIWDTGDSALDSTVVLDNFKWTAEPGTTVGTAPVPDPK